MTRERRQRIIALRPGDAPLPLPVALADAPPLLSQRDTAKMMGVGLRTLQALIADGTIFAIPVGVTGKYVKIPIFEIEKWRNGRYAAQQDHGVHRADEGQGR